MGLRILHLAAGLGDPNSGGIQEVARTGWEGLKRHRRNGSADGLLCFGRGGGLTAESPKERIVSAQSRAGLLLQAAARNWDAEQLVVWHLGLLKLLPWLRGRQGPVAAFLYGIDAWKRFDARDRRLFERVSLFLSISQFTWDRFVEFNPEFADHPHRILHLGMEHPLETPPPPPDQPPTALIISRMLKAEDYKGHRELIAAWPAVRERIEHAKLWVVGDGDLRGELEQEVARTGQSEWIRFLGRIPEEHKQGLLRRCRTLAMPSRGEGFGLVYLEAMRIGRPCLVSNCDAGQEVVNPPEAGLAVEPHDSTALTNAMVRLLSNGPEWENWSRAARDRYENNFTVGHYQRRLANALFKTGSR